MKIVFAMWSTKRTGGTNAIFHVADRLSEYGNEITIVSGGARDFMWFKFKGHVKFHYPEEDLAWHVKLKKQKFSSVELADFALKKFNIRIDRTKILTNSLNKYGFDADIIIATYFETALPVYRTICKSCRKFYYIQHFESVFFEDEYNKHRVHETYFLPLEWIVSSSWANGKLTELTGKTGLVVVPGIDTSIFYPRKVIKDGTKNVVLSLGKSAKVKGLLVLFKALEKLKNKVPNLKLILYGTEPTVKNNSPVETEYITAPSNERLAELYSLADVVVTPSFYESSPSPPLEAMACGTPVVTTREGTEDYCFDGENSIVVPSGDPEAMSNAIFRIIDDKNLAKKLMKNGIEKAQELSWDKTAEIFRERLKK